MIVILFDFTCKDEENSINRKIEESKIFLQFTCSLNRTLNSTDCKDFSNFNTFSSKDDVFNRFSIIPLCLLYFNPEQFQYNIFHHRHFPNRHSYDIFPGFFTQ